MEQKTFISSSVAKRLSYCRQAPGVFSMTKPKFLSMTIATTLSISAASPALAQYAQPTYLPPVVVYAPPPPDPFAAMFMLPFAIFGGIANAFPPYATIVPDGQGGWVPITNSRIMPDGSLRPFDPALDLPPSQPNYQQQTPLPSPPRRHHAHHEPQSSGACYDSSGKFVGQNNPDCAGDSGPVQ